MEWLFWWNVGNYNQFLGKINKKYNLEKLIEFVICRDDRYSLERVIGLIFTTENNYDKQSVFGIIFEYCKWGYLYSTYLHQKQHNTLLLPVIKVWSGR